MTDKRPETSPTEETEMTDKRPETSPTEEKTTGVDTPLILSVEIQIDEHHVLHDGVDFHHGDRVWMGEADALRLIENGVAHRVS